MSVSPSSLKTILSFLGVLGLWGTWGRSAINGTLNLLFDALHTTGILPGTLTPIKTSFTGIYFPIDYLLDVLILFFWQAVDGSHPTTSVFGLYFASQHVSVITTLYMDTYRNKNGWKSDATLWLLMFQLTAIAASGPWFVLMNLATTQVPHISDLQHSRQLSPTKLNSIRTIPLSIFTSYLSLTIFMALPSSGQRALISPAAQQVAVAAWNIFPLFMALTQSLFPTILSLLPFPSISRQTILSILRTTYAFSFLLSSAFHIATLTTTLTPLMFPTLFATSTPSLFHPGSLFQLPMSLSQVPSLGAGGLQFMQWDMVVGFAAVLVPAVVRYERALKMVGRDVSLGVLGLQVVAAIILLGPGGVLVGLRYLEDEALFDFEGREEKKGRKET